jgi:hypothetical protein
MRFVDGLRDDIKVSEHLQGPTSLDSACVVIVTGGIGGTRSEDFRKPGERA